MINYLGGSGFCAKILWEEVSSKIQALSPENLLIFATGPVTGTPFPPAGRYVIASKSPLTGIWGESHSGGHFGPELKFAGFDYLIVEGRSPAPVYISMHDKEIKIKDASQLWGKDTLETTKMIKELENDSETKVACIGLAGENLVKYACIINDIDQSARAAGRSGMGAVMGSKNLKAIAVRGSNDISVADPEAFYKVVEEAMDMCTKGEWSEASENSLGKYGTPNLINAMNEIGRLPTKNHFTGVYSNHEDIGPQKIRANYRIGRDACFQCPIACKYVSLITRGSFAGTLTGGPEYESVMGFGSNCLNPDIESIIHANMLCNLYGLDTISCGKAISWAMECYENNLFTKKEISNLDLSWGNKETIIELVHQITKKHGLGKLLAEGVKKASAKLGRGSAKYAMHVKGLEISGQDGRSHKSIGLTHAIGLRGADHLRSLCTVDELGYRKIAMNRFGKDNVDDICSLLSEQKKGLIVKDQEDFFAVVDSLIICKYGTMWPPIYYFDFLAKVLPPLTGIEKLGSVKELRLVGERIVTLRRCFNIREGFTRKDDMLPDRFTKDPMPEGPGKGQTVDLKLMLNDYYKLREWHPKTGIPKKEKLAELGL
jgi:aldehyde:ferredoxin oxidoreductase